MSRYGFSANYLELKYKYQKKGATLYIDGWPKATRNIVDFINSIPPRSTLKQPNCIFEGHEENLVFVCIIKSLDGGEELVINYNLNQVDTNTVTMEVGHPTIYPTFY